MPVYSGSSKIKEILAGTSKIKEVWAENQKVWSSAPPPMAPLPTNFCLIGCLGKNNAAQTLSDHLVGDRNTTIKVGWKFSSAFFAESSGSSGIPDINIPEPSYVYVCVVKESVDITFNDTDTQTITGIKVFSRDSGKFKIKSSSSNAEFLMLSIPRSYKHLAGFHYGLKNKEICVSVPTDGSIIAWPTSGIKATSTVVAEWVYDDEMVYSPSKDDTTVTVKAKDGVQTSLHSLDTVYPHHEKVSTDYNMFGIVFK